MIPRKYIKDYRIDEDFGINGRVKSKAVYIGADYTLSPPVPFGVRRLVLCLSALAGLTYIGALIPEMRAARLIYVMLPFAFSALPVYFMIASSISLLRFKETASRVEADRIANRLPPSALIAAILAGGSFIGFVVSAAAGVSAGVRGGMSQDAGSLAGDYIFSVLAPLLTFLSATVFVKTKRIKAEAVI